MNSLFLITPWQIVLALFLDFVIGDPRSRFHPARMMGAVAGRLERWSRERFEDERRAGCITVVMTLVLTACGTTVLLVFSAAVHPSLLVGVKVLLLYSVVASRDMSVHAANVKNLLENNNLPEARQAVGLIVGRDTQALDEEGITRATVESVAESIVDGVTAPVFYAFLFGPLGAVMYRAVNTLDSMFGYKNERYVKFGRAPARLDDVLNWIPARLTGLLIPLAAFVLGYKPRQAWRILQRDHDKQRSPNSGWPEAAAAGALGIQLGGSNVYFGKVMEKPAIGDAEKPLDVTDISKINRLAIVAAALFVGLGGLFWWILPFAA